MPGERAWSGEIWHQGPTKVNLVSCRAIATDDGRYHRRDSPNAWYASTMAHAAWLEWYRHDGVSGASRRFGSARAIDLHLLDLTDARVRDTLGMTAAELTSDNLATCQELADRAREAKGDGVIAPSAAPPSAATVAVFFHALAKVTEIDSALTPAPPLWRLRLRELVRSLLRV